LQKGSTNLLFLKKKGFQGAGVVRRHGPVPPRSFARRQEGQNHAEVPKLFSSPQPASNASFYKTVGVRQSKRARVELANDDEDYLIIPNLGGDI
jgi:hypothetical protein